jgi:alpha-ribazole phosphatase/probable phosphoglycerate mutase
MITKLYLIRHGETEGAEARRYKGHIDVPLSEEGIHQVGQLSRLVALNSENGLDAVYSSDLDRAVKSAEIIAEPFGLKPVVIRDLRERSFGVWEGMSFDEIHEQYPGDFKAWAEDPLSFSPVNGETTLEARERALRALSLIHERHEGGVVAAVSHGGMTRILLCEFLGIPLQNLFRIEQDFASLNIIEFHDGHPVVKLLNGAETAGR